MVTKIEIENKECIMNYTGEKPRPFFKIHTNVPKSVAYLKTVIEKGCVSTISGSMKTYESNIPFALRFMIDTGIVGMCWLELPRGMYSHRIKTRRRSNSQIEVDIPYRALIVHKPEGEWSKIPPLRVLSFDIEVCNNGVTFPTPDKNEVIQIGNICKVPGSESTISRCIMTLGKCTDIADARVISFEREEDLLMA